GEAVDHGDDRLVHRLERLRHAVNALPEAVLAVKGAALALPHAPDVAARAEGAPGARDDDDVDAVVLLGRGERLRPRVDHVARERVQLVRPVQGDRRDLVLHLVEQVTHGSSSSWTIDVSDGASPWAARERARRGYCAGSRT